MVEFWEDCDEDDDVHDGIHSSFLYSSLYPHILHGDAHDVRSIRSWRSQTAVLAVLLLENLHKVLHHPLIKIFTSQVCVTIGGHHLKNTVVDGQQGNIEGAASQVVDQDVLLLEGGLT